MFSSTIPGRLHLPQPRNAQLEALSQSIFVSFFFHLYSFTVAFVVFKRFFSRGGKNISSSFISIFFLSKTLTFLDSLCQLCFAQRFDSKILLDVISICNCSGAHRNTRRISVWLFLFTSQSGLMTLMSPPLSSSCLSLFPAGKTTVTETGPLKLIPQFERTSESVITLRS